MVAAAFAPRNEAPLVLGTRGHMLGLYLVLDNPAPMVADYPGAYRDQPGFDCIREIPTWWDETRVLRAEAGRLLVSARRCGDAVLHVRLAPDGGGFVARLAPSP